MKIHSFFWFPAVLASLAFATSVKAEEVSTKAADLMGVSTDNQNPSNLLAQSSDPGFIPVAPTPGSDTPLYTGGDINPDLPASNYPYGSLSVGFGSQSNVDLKVIGEKAGEVSFNGGFSINSAVIGYQFEQVRAELETGYRFFSAKEYIPAVAGATAQLLSSSIATTTILLNGYYDIPTGSKLRPYIGGGIGLGFFRGYVNSINVDGSSFTWQAKAGIQYEVVRKGNIFGEFKYTSAGSYTLKERINLSELGLGRGTIYPELGSLNSFGVAIGYRQGF